MDYKFLGTTKVPCVDGVLRTFSVWAQQDMFGKVISIRHNISNSEVSASETLSRHDCQTSIQKQLLRFADQRVWEDHDDTVIEEGGDYADT